MNLLYFIPFIFMNNLLNLLFFFAPNLNSLCYIKYIIFLACRVCIEFLSKLYRYTICLNAQMTKHKLLKLEK